MLLCSWDKLPDSMRIPEVKPYYDHLKKKNVELFFKRFFDILLSLILIVILGIPMIIIAIMVKKDSEGPVFFRQERVTQYGKHFRIHKFRTMKVGSDKKSQVTASDDSRITEVGKKLRDHRLDEFPQLFDILSGNMTFVGTRPEVPKYVDQYDNEYMATLLLPAGLTSPASIQFKDEAEMLQSSNNVDDVYMNEVLPKKMEINLRYLTQFNLLKDLEIMFSTVIRVND